MSQQRINNVQAACLNDLALPASPAPMLGHGSYQAMTGDLGVLIGHRGFTGNFSQALMALVRGYNLPIDPQDEQYLGFILNGLARATRFGNSIHMPHETRENTGVHSIMCVALNHEILRRAGLLVGDLALSPRATEIRVLSSLALLVHDGGELLEELRSLDQRMRGNVVENMGAIERSIFETMSRHALVALRSGRPGSFYQLQDRLISTIKSLTPSRGLGEAVSAALLSAPAEHLTNEEERRLDRFLRLYDLAESELGFIGSYVKAVEHSQGTRHWNRYGFAAGKIPRRRVLNSETTPSGESTYAPPDVTLSVPMPYSEMSRLASQTRYVEGELPRLFARAQCAEERALAHAMRDVAYATILEMLNDGPYVWRRGAKGSTPWLLPHIHDLDSELLSHDIRRGKAEVVSSALRDQQRAVLREYRAAQRGAFKPAVHSLKDLETRATLTKLYAHAIEVRYEPREGDPPLALMNDLPESLHFSRSGNRFKALQQVREVLGQRAELRNE